MERHSPRNLLVHLGISPMPTILKGSNDTKTPRNLTLADSIVARTLEIIRFLQPQAWLMENPQTGLLKTREVVEGLPWRDVTYCSYGEGQRWTYKKQTRFWGNLDTFAPRTVCSRATPCCFSAATGVHPDRAQRCNRNNGVNHTLNELYSMPTQLCDDIAKAVADIVA